MKNFVRSFAASAVIAGAAATAAGFPGRAVSQEPVAAKAAAADGAPRLVARLSEKILYVQLGDSVVDMYDISDGKDPYPTPRGKFNIRKLTWNPSWRPPDSEWAMNKKATAPGDPKNPMKVVKIFFKEPDYYIHGTANLESLGSADSHGCLRMSPDDVMEVGKWVMENGGAAQQENWFMRVLHFRRQEKVIYLSTPVSIEVVE